MADEGVVTDAGRETSPEQAPDSSGVSVVDDEAPEALEDSTPVPDVPIAVPSDEGSGEEKLGTMQGVNVYFLPAPLSSVAYLGLIKNLERQGVPIKKMNGASFGSIIAGSYAKERNANTLEWYFFKLFSEIFGKDGKPIAHAKWKRPMQAIFFEGFEQLYGGNEVFEVSPIFNLKTEKFIVSNSVEKLKGTYFNFELPQIFGSTVLSGYCSLYSCLQKCLASPSCKASFADAYGLSSNNKDVHIFLGVKGVQNHSKLQAWLRRGAGRDRVFFQEIDLGKGQAFTKNLMPKFIHQGEMQTKQIVLALKKKLKELNQESDQ